MHNPRVRVAARVEGQKICVASRQDTPFGQGKRKDFLKIVRPEQIRVDQRKCVVAAKSQGSCNRVIDVLVNQKSYVHD
jgi:hypothetical protein